MLKSAGILILVPLFLSSIALASSLSKDSERAKDYLSKLNRQTTQEILFDCNFDMNDCDIEYDPNDLIDDTPMFTIYPTLLTDSGYNFTDFTSITEPTINGLPCQIPFNLSGTEYFHCTGNEQCQTSSGLSTCKQGLFLNGKFNKPEQRNTIYFPIFSYFFDDMLYELTFQAFMYCEGDADCAKSNDVIQVGVYSFYGTDLVKVTKTVKQSDFAKPKAWQKFSLELSAINNAYYAEVVVVKDFYPQAGNSTTYYGIDNIKIKFVERYDKVFICDFDSNDCNFGIASGTFEHLAIRDKITAGSRIFTDFSSTSRPTANNDTCTIPFYVNETISYHCTKDNQCLTSTGWSQCSAGRFLGGYTNNSIAGSYVERASTRVQVPITPATYRLSYRVLMFCDGDQDTCKKSTDFFDTYVNIGGAGLAQELLSLKNFEGREGWMKVESDFYTESSAFSLAFAVGRYSYSDAITYFGVDEFKISLISKELSEFTTVSSTATSRTSTSSTQTRTTTTTTTRSTSTTSSATFTSRSSLSVILSAVLVSSSIIVTDTIGAMFYFKKPKAF